MRELINSFGVVQDILAVVMGSLVLFLIKDYHLRNKGIVAAASLVGLAVSVLGYICIGVASDSSELASVVSVLMAIVLPQIIMKPGSVRRPFTKRLSSIFLCSFWLLFVNVIIEAPLSIMAIFTGMDLGLKELELLEEIILVVTYIITVILSAFFVSSKQISNFRNVIESTSKWATPVLAMFGMVGTGTPYLMAIDTIPSVVLSIIAAIGFTGVIFIIVYFMFRVLSLTVKQNDILRRFDDQQSGYEKMLKSDEQLREFRHDYKNHMMVVTALLNAGKTEEASEYLDTIKISSGIVGRQFSTGNFIVDAILNNKNALAGEFAIELSFNGAVPEGVIENADICTIVSNLIDNAIESVKRYDGARYIKVKASIRSGFLALSVINPVNSRVEVKNNKIRTTKKDSKNHGIGLKNVQRTAEKYGGAMLLDCTDTEFTADVTVKLKH